MQERRSTFHWNDSVLGEIYTQCQSEKAQPLHNLVKKGTAWQWNHEQQKAFQDLQQACCERPILEYYDVTKPVISQAIDLYIQEAATRVSSTSRAYVTQITAVLTEGLLEERK